MAKAAAPATNTGWEGGEEVQSNWFKFVKVGDGIKGTLIAKRFQKATTPGFPDQLVVELKNEAGEVFNVGISVNKQGTVQRLTNCKLGQIIGILFEKEGEPGTKGFAAAKFLKVFSFGMDKNYTEMSGGEEVEPVDEVEM